MATATRTPAQTFALVFGVVYLLVGLIGFAYVQFDGFAAAQPDSEELLGIFGINGLHNLVHLAIGGLFLAGSRSHANAKGINSLIGVVYLLVGLLGLFQLDFVKDLLDNNSADTILHLVTGVLALYFGTAGAEGGTRAAPAA